MSEPPSPNNTNQADGRSSAGSGKAKRKPKPTNRAKNRKKKIKARYVKAREDAQLAGIIPTTPDGAVKDERVDPQLQGSAIIPAAIRQALRECWATPDAAKPAIIAALLEPFFTEDVVVGSDGKEIRVKPSRKVLIEAAKTLRLLDSDQYERDHPKETGAGVNVSVGVAVAGSVFDRAAEYEEQLRKRLVVEEGSPLPSNGAGQQVDPPHTNGTAK